ncbi:MAG: TIGR04282 family arsenosugar biosynthesis glycosyltransferase [Saprospiraceae bacterium]|nr:TIGR04282 family arsenosugar biosynthesis glycosyltransferase [Saprospiraceae bacterium]
MLIIFIKNPRLGHVKTRLAATLGAESALKVYRYLLDKTRETALLTPVRRALFYSEAVSVHDDWPDAFFEKKIQHPGDLGERMSEAFRLAFADGAEKAVIIGSDCPDLSADVLMSAFEALESNDLVVGPSADGGYYLLGMNRFVPALFEGVAWSTDQVLRQTRTTATHLALRVHTLVTLRDIDEEADWQDYLQRHPEEADRFF